MKKLILIFIMATFFTACAAPQTSGPNPEVQSTEISASAPTPSVDVLLAAALKLFDEGKYEEAILQYTAVINIEPKNFDAQFGLGQAYRKNKQSDNAIVPLKAALSIRAESKPAAIELGYAYLDTGAYAEAEKLARELLGDRMPDLSVQLREEAKSPLAPVPSLSKEENEALTLMFLSLCGHERTNEARVLWEQGMVQLPKLEMEGDVIYFGLYNADGKREGKGIGIYIGGEIYAGGYKGGVRSGRGQMYFNNRSYFFTGKWADDAPNGYGELWLMDYKFYGNYMNGLEHGAMALDDSWGGTFHYQSKNGKRIVIGEAAAVAGGSFYVWGWKDNDDVRNAMGKGINDIDVIYGVPEWGVNSYGVLFTPID